MLIGERRVVFVNCLSASVFTIQWHCGWEGRAGAIAHPLNFGLSENLLVGECLSKNAKFWGWEISIIWKCRARILSTYNICCWKFAVRRKIATFCPTYFFKPRRHCHYSLGWQCNRYFTFWGLDWLSACDWEHLWSSGLSHDSVSALVPGYSNAHSLFVVYWFSFSAAL